MSQSWCQIRSLLSWNKNCNLVCPLNVPNPLPLLTLIKDLVISSSLKLKLFDSLFNVNEDEGKGSSEIDKEASLKQQLNEKCTYKHSTSNVTSSLTSSSKSFSSTFPLPDLVPVQEREIQLMQSQLTQIGLELRDISLKFEQKRSFFL